MTQTNATKRAIVEYLNLHGHAAHSNNTTGIYDPARRTFRRLADRNAVGSGDVLCCLKNGFWLEIEVKTGKDRQSDSQKLRQAKIESVGGLYWLVKSFPEFEAKYLEHMGKKKPVPSKGRA